MMHKWEFPVLKAEAWDGDSVRLLLDVGFYGRHEELCRLLNVDAPEKYNRAGEMVTRVVDRWLSRREGELMFLCVEKRTKYGYPGGLLYCTTDPKNDLSTWLINNGLAKHYDGRAKLPWDDSELLEVEAKCRELLA